jgi:hypothetical protein
MEIADKVAVERNTVNGRRSGPRSMLFARPMKYGGSLIWISVVRCRRFRVV